MEKLLYESIRKKLIQLFLSQYKNCHLEITNKTVSDELKSNFDDITLFFLRKHLYPDLMGFVKDSENNSLFIVVEIKDKKIDIRDFYQAKMYAEAFKASFCFLISTKPLSEEIKRVLKSKNWIGRYTKLVKIESEIIPNKEYHFPGSVFFVQYDKKKGRILDFSWFPNNPFLQKT